MQTWLKIDITSMRWLYFTPIVIKNRVSAYTAGTRSFFSQFIPITSAWCSPSLILIFGQVIEKNCWPKISIIRVPSLGLFKLCFKCFILKARLKDYPRMKMKSCLHSDREIVFIGKSVFSSSPFSVQRTGSRCRE